MTIALSDLPAAVREYLDNEVTVEIGKLTTGLQPGESGSFTVRVSNAGVPTGIRLVDLKYHLTSSNEDILELEVPGSSLFVTRATTNPNDPELPRGDLVTEMVVFPPPDLAEFGSSLDVGHVREIEFTYRGAGAGPGQIRCHLHASIDESTLFPGNVRTKVDHIDVAILR